MNGTIIKAKIEAGYTFTVRMGPNQKYDKFIMEFRLWDPTKDHFFNATKFQAIKYLSGEQVEAVKAFEEIQNIRGMKDKHFGRYLDALKVLEKTCAENKTYFVIREAHDQLLRQNYITLNFAKE